MKGDATNDCYYDNCEAGDSASGKPIWDSSAAAGEGGNPELSDDLSSYGPESISVKAALDGQYQVVAVCSTSTAASGGPYSTVSTVTVQANGSELYSGEHSLIPSETEIVGVITVEGGVASFATN